MGNLLLSVLRYSGKISLDDLYSFSNFFIGWIFGKVIAECLGNLLLSVLG